MGGSVVDGRVTTRRFGDQIRSGRSGRSGRSFFLRYVRAPRVCVFSFILSRKQQYTQTRGARLARARIESNRIESNRIRLNRTDRRRW